MKIVVSLAVALALGVVWVLVLRHSSSSRTVAGAPKDVSRLLSSYRRSAWADVASGAPAILARPGDGGDETWRPALELALGHALVELDRPDEAIPHLERGLLLQAAVRRAQGGGEGPEAGEAKLRHVLGWAYASTGRTAQARKEYRRVLELPSLDPEVRAKVQTALDAL